jgi:hypothetical protein
MALRSGALRWSCSACSVALFSRASSRSLAIASQLCASGFFSGPRRAEKSLMAPMYDSSRRRVILLDFSAEALIVSRSSARRWTRSRSSRCLALSMYSMRASRSCWWCFSANLNDVVWNACPPLAPPSGELLRPVGRPS